MLKNLDFSRGLVKVFYVCPVCGDVVDAITFTQGPVCGTDSQKFKVIMPRSGNR
jgi:rubrerythrin